MTWTEERIEMLKSLWADKSMSCSQIGCLMGVSRNAVIGKVRRLGLEFRSHRESAALAMQRPEVRDRMSEAAKRRWADPERRQRQGEAIRRARAAGSRLASGATDLPPVSSPFSVQLVDLDSHHCRWPLGEPSEMTFCGDRALDGYPYCVRHCRVAYTT